MSADSVAAVSLAYFLDTGEEWKTRRGAAWEAAFLETARQLNETLPNIHVSRSHFRLSSSFTLRKGLSKMTYIPSA
jgi:hypothetical protein